MNDHFIVKEENSWKDIKAADSFSPEHSSEALPEDLNIKEQFFKRTPSSQCEHHNEITSKLVTNSCSYQDMKMPSATRNFKDTETVGLPEDSTLGKRIQMEKATSTDGMEEEEEEGNEKELRRCKYCKARLSKLKLLESMKSRHSTMRFFNHASRSPLQRQTVYKNKSCQTSAYLFEKAEMTGEEKKNLSMILRLKDAKASKNETFCKCALQGKEKECRCGEHDKYFEWVWDSVTPTQATDLFENDRLVIFHKDFSCGTAAIRGNQALKKDQYFWEIKMTSPVYGTDMMVGVGTEAVDLNSYASMFCSMLGYDGDSWGISYDGRIQHNSLKEEFCSKFAQGAIIGVHLDMWHGTMTLFKNRQSLGTAFRGLRGRTLYPMASSTAARTAMRIISSRSFPTSLQFMCCQKLRQCVPAHLDVLKALTMPPGLRQYLANNMAWLVHALCPQARDSSTREICTICQPMQDVLEGLTDSEENEEEDRRDLYLLFPSDDESSNGEEEKSIFPSPSSRVVGSRRLNEYGEGSSSQFLDVATYAEDYPFGFKRFKCDGGRTHILLEKEEGFTCEDGKEKNDDSDSEMNEQLRLSRKRKRGQLSDLAYNTY